MSRPVASGVFLIVVGLWVTLQTVVGNLPSRLLSWARRQDPDFDQPGGGDWSTTGDLA